MIDTKNVRVTPETIHWIWEGVIPCGAVTLIAGAPMVGKSEMVLDLAIRLSSGRPFPGERKGVVGEVLYFLGDEDPALFIIQHQPKLLAISDPRKLRFAKQMPTSIDELKTRLTKKPGVKMVVIDPISTFLLHDQNDCTKTRKAVAALESLAQETGVAVVAIVHLNKGTKGKSRWVRSSAFMGMVRMVWVIEKNKDRRILTPVKNNLVAQPKSHAFRMYGGVMWEEEG